MFNSYAAWREEFIAVQMLNASDRKIYEAREAQYRPFYKWSGELERLWSNCLIHMSPNVPGKVAYFSSVDMLRLNRTTRTSPQMFLERYLANAPEEIKFAWEQEVLGKTLPEVKFINNDDPNGWFRIYDNGPSSCMKGCRLVECYANPRNHLALAYYERDGHVFNRTIVNKKTMAYARIYGDHNAPFAYALRKLGYHHSAADTLEGELIYVEQTSCCSCENSIITGPFLDCENNYVKVDYENERSEGRIGDEGDTVIYNSNDEGDFRCESCA